MKPRIVEPAAERTEEDEMSTSVSPTTITDHELEQVERANATTATPVVFIHGLWLLPSSWANWADFFKPGRLRAADAGLARRSGNG